MSRSEAPARRPRNSVRGYYKGLEYTRLLTVRLTEDQYRALVGAANAPGARPGGAAALVRGLIDQHVVPNQGGPDA